MDKIEIWIHVAVEEEIGWTRRSYYPYFPKAREEFLKLRKTMKNWDKLRSLYTTNTPYEAFNLLRNIQEVYQRTKKIQQLINETNNSEELKERIKH